MDRITATWTANGTSNSIISRETSDDIPGGLPSILAAVSARYKMGAVVIEIKRIQTRRQAEKESV